MSVFKQYVYKPLNVTGELVFLFIDVIKAFFSTHKLFSKVIEQSYYLGVRSFFSTVVTASFIGMVFTLQIVTEFEKFGANYLIGGIVGLAIWRELGPLITSVVASGRIGAAISSEIATMKVSEQLEAIESLSFDPIKVLLAPRILATTIMRKFCLTMLNDMYFRLHRLMALFPFHRIVVVGTVVALIICETLMFAYCIHVILKQLKF